MYGTDIRSRRGDCGIVARGYNTPNALKKTHNKNVDYNYVRDEKSHSGSDAEQRGHLEVSVVVVGEHDNGGCDNVAQGPHGGHGAYAHGQRDGYHGRTGAGHHVHGIPDASPRVDARVRERGGIAAGYDVVHDRVLPGLQVTFEPVLD